MATGRESSRGAAATGSVPALMADTVNSPMAQLSGKELYINVVTFMQDNSLGTRTVISAWNQPKNKGTDLSSSSMFA
jgi:hypothetical protein